MPEIKVRSLSVAYGGEKVLDRLDLTVRDGELFVLLGPSGAGKTTLVNVITGFVRPLEGSVDVGGRTVASPSVAVPPSSRGLSAVFQDGALWPHMTVLQHLLFVLEGKMPRSEARRRAAEFLAMVKLEGFEDRHPDELSGGERQRVAIARALAMSTDLLLADEPTGNLDSRNSRDVFSLLRELNERDGLTIVATTHDEKLGATADRSIHLCDGRLVM